LGHAAATAVTLPTGDSFTIVLEREFVRGPVERDAIDRLDAIRPDIARVPAARTGPRDHPGSRGAWSGGSGLRPARQSHRGQC
jgi:hypothetical protein